MAVGAGEDEAAPRPTKSNGEASLADHDTPPEKPLEQFDGSLPFSTRISLEAAGHGRIGWLLLGPRPDGSLLGKDEREALLAIADPLARALQVARRREAKDGAQASLLAALSERLGRLERTVEVQLARDQKA